MTTFLQFFLSLTSVGLSFGAFYLAHQTYKRQRTFENENHLFRFNIDRYLEAYTEIAEHINFIRRVIDEYYEEIDGEENPDMEFVYAQRDKVDRRTEEFDLMITRKFIFGSEIVAEKIVDWLDACFNANFLNCNNSPSYEIKHHDLNWQRDYDNIDKLEDMLYGIIDAMRADARVPELHEKLQERLAVANAEKKVQRRPSKLQNGK